MLLSLRDLTIRFPGAPETGAAVSALSLSIAAGETQSLVGASGSGKSLTCLALMNLLPPAAERVSGSAVFDGEELFTLPEGALIAIRGRRLAMIFQDPVRALNPVTTIGAQFRETLLLHRGLTGRAAEKEAEELLTRVGIPDAALRAKAYPHQLSGGMCQRAMIAMAIAARPDLLIADEPTTALDLTTQAQILSLLQDLQRQFGTAILLVTHDMGVVAELADQVAVMAEGAVVEQGAVHDILRQPKHPATREIVSDALRLPLPDAIEAPQLSSRGGVRA